MTTTTTTTTIAPTTTNATMSNNGVPNESEPPENGAYAKLSGRTKQGQKFNAYIRSLPAKLGRVHSKTPQGFIGLGISKNISRIHAVIDFDKEQDKFYIEPRGKNGIIVEGRYYGEKETGSGDKTHRIYLESKTPVCIGNLGFFFLLPSCTRPEGTWEQIILRVFEKHPEPKTVRELSDMLSERYLYFRVEYGTEDKLTILRRAIANCCNKAKGLAKAGTKEENRYTNTLWAPAESSYVKDYLNSAAYLAEKEKNEKKKKKKMRKKSKSKVKEKAKFKTKGKGKGKRSRSNSDVQTNKKTKILVSE